VCMCVCVLSGVMLCCDDDVDDGMHDEAGDTDYGSFLHTILTCTKWIVRSLS